MRNATLHAALRAYVEEAGAVLGEETARGAEVPFEVLEEPGGSAALYCYRPLTGRFIAERERLLLHLPSAPVARAALERVEGLEAHARRLDPAAAGASRRSQAGTVLAALLGTVYDWSTDFAFSEERFARAYAELEGALYAGRSLSTVLAPVLGLALESAEVPLGDGVALMRADARSDEPPSEAVRGEGGEPLTLLVLERADRPGETGAVTAARGRFRRILTALRLYDDVTCALGPLAWLRVDGGSWRPVPLAAAGRPRGRLVVAAEQEDELRAFCNLVARRAPAGGELAWALSRYEMACERRLPFEALTDVLLALRALLEPEGPESGWLPRRLAALCAAPGERAALAERAAHAVSLERAIVAGVTPPDPHADGLVEEMGRHLRALVRDALCGHLDSDLRSVADDVLAETAA